MSKGEIYLAKLNPTKGSEISKVRPVIIFQSNYLKELPTLVVIPLTTHLKDDWFPLRVRITKRGKLEKDSDAVIEQIKAIDKNRIVGNPIASLSDDELRLIEEAVLFVLGIK
ncbi:type II toxin-antitoxin system PemK/MazF family toxin [Persephonella sp.]